MTLATRIAAAALLALGAASAALAQGADAYPSKPVRLIVPFAPGGATDVVARIISQRLAEALKQPVLVENKAGANGIIGTEFVARAAPDGYTLLVNTAGAQVLSPHLYKANYDPLKSFAPISLIANLGLVLVVHPSVPASNMQEFIALAKSRNKPMNYASGSSMIGLIGEQFKALYQLPQIANVSYKGTGPQMEATVKGEADFTVDPFVSLQLIKAGKLKPLAVTTTKRSPSLPNVPTMREAGVSDMDFSTWAAVLAPAGTPPEIVKRLNAEIVKIVALPDVREKLAAQDYEPQAGTPEQLAALITEDSARWQRIVKERNFKAE